MNRRGNVVIINKSGNGFYEYFFRSNLIAKIIILGLCLICVGGLSEELEQLGMCRFVEATQIYNISGFGHWNCTNLATACDWGISCSEACVRCENNSVVELEFHLNSIQPATIPTQIGYLNSLKNLDLSSGNFIGSVPTQLGTLSALNTLNLAFTSLSGNIPSQLENLPLKTLLLQNTRLCGCFPNKWLSITWDNCNVSGVIHNCSCTLPNCAGTCSSNVQCSSFGKTATISSSVPLPAPKNYSAPVKQENPNETSGFIVGLVFLGLSVFTIIVITIVSAVRQITDNSNN